MTIKTVALKDALATTYGTQSEYGAIYTTAPTATAGAEPTGGAPAYTRKPLSWGAPSNGAITATATFDVPEDTTVVGVGVHSALSGGTYLDGAEVTSQAFASQGTFVVTFTYTQS